MLVRYPVLFFFTLLSAGTAFAQSPDTAHRVVYDYQTQRKILFGHNKINEYHSSVGAEYAFGWQTSKDPFFREGANRQGKEIRNVNTFYLKYAIMPKKGSWEYEVYGPHYEGIGVGYNTFFAKEALGNPVSVFLFQGAPLVTIFPRLSLDYEWKFGIATGWVPYDFETNPNNLFVGSRTTAFIGVGLNLNYEVIRNIRLKAGLELNHYSNGNTTLPNKSVNTVTPYVGLVYDFNSRRRQLTERVLKQRYPSHMQYEMMIYGGVSTVHIDTTNAPGMSPFPKRKYAFGGVEFAAVYRPGYRVAFGGAVDLSYNDAAGLSFVYDQGIAQFYSAPLYKKIYVGVAARVDYIMPFFTLSGKLGYDLFNHREGYNGFYQTIGLKVKVAGVTSLKVALKVNNFSMPEGIKIGIAIDFNKQNM